MKYAARRLFSFLLTMVIVSFLAFMAFDLISGDSATALLGTEATPEAVAALRAEMGLDRPLPVRYGEWLLGFFTGDLGTSYVYHQSVSEIIAPKIAVTLLLSFVSFLLIVLISSPLGLSAAKRSGGVIEAGETALNQFCMAVPPFFTGMLLSYLFGVSLKWFMPGMFPDFHTDFGGAMRHIFFAAIAISIPRIAMTVRMLKSTIQAEMRKDYVRTAISRGNDRSAVLRLHVLKNSLVPVITFLAQTMAEIVAGGIVVEQVFAIPGLGRMLVSSISNRDYPMVMGTTIFLATIMVIMTLISDILYKVFDPRVDLG